MTPGDFVYQALPARIVFGSGNIKLLADEVSRLCLKRVVVLCSDDVRSQRQAVLEWLGDRAAGSFADIRMHTPVSVTAAALELVKKVGADGLVAVGGGSTTGLSKAIALRTRLPQIVVPTTYAGSEVTPILGETSEGRKNTQRTLDVLPTVVIYDPQLTLGLSAAMSVTSGLNAIAHAAEALYAWDRNPITSMMADAGIRALIASLPQILADPGNLPAREQALYGAWLCGTCLAAVSMALHHKLCHTLGGALDLPHSETHAVVLPYTLAYTLPYAPHAQAVLANIFGSADPAQALFALSRRLNAPGALRVLGMAESEIDHVTALCLQNSYGNPRPIERNELRALIADAWAGAPPRSY